MSVKKKVGTHCVGLVYALKKLCICRLKKKRPQPAYMWKSHMKNAYAKHGSICETYATENGRLFDSKMIAYASKNIHIHD